MAQSPGSAQEPGYLRITDAKGAIAGDSKDAGHVGWIKVQSVQYRSSAGSTSVKHLSSGETQSSPATANPVDSPAVNSPNGAAPAPSTGSSNRPPNARTSWKGQSITIVKDVDKSSRRLQQAQASGEKLKEVIVDFQRGKAPVRIDLRDVTVALFHPFTRDQKALEMIRFMSIDESSGK